VVHVEEPVDDVFQLAASGIVTLRVRCAPEVVGASRSVRARDVKSDSALLSRLTKTKPPKFAADRVE